MASWQDMVDESKVYFETVYARLGVLLEEADAIGESYYNHMLADVCADLEASGPRTPATTRQSSSSCREGPRMAGERGRSPKVPTLRQASGPGKAHPLRLAADADRVPPSRGREGVHTPHEADATPSLAAEGRRCRR